MFDFAWSEMAVIAVVALVAIGPKDMPVALKALTGTIRKARRMAAEFQTHVDEMMREANLEEVRQSLNEIRSGVVSEVQKQFDPIREGLSDPFAATTRSPAVSAAGNVSEAAVTELERSGEAGLEAAPAFQLPGVPAFIPPQIVREAEETVLHSDAPAFVPPSVVSPQA